MTVIAGQTNQDIYASIKSQIWVTSASSTFTLLHYFISFSIYVISSCVARRWKEKKNSFANVTVCSQTPLTNSACCAGKLTIVLPHWKVMLLWMLLLLSLHFLELLKSSTAGETFRKESSPMEKKNLVW